MSNVGFLFLKPKIPLEDLKKDIDKISNERFDGKVNCEIVSTPDVIKSWGNPILEINYNTHFIVTLCYYVDIKDVLAWEHSNNGHFGSYIESTIKNILSEKYNAYIGDEGIGGFDDDGKYGGEKYKGKDRGYKNFYEHIKGFKERMSIKKKNLGWFEKRRLKQFADEEERCYNK